MERHTPKEQRDTLDVIQKEAPHLHAAAVVNFYDKVMGLARRLHDDYVGECSTDLGAEGNARRQRRVRDLERQIKAQFEAAGLGLYLNGDPRGNPVGILTPRTGRFNTMGGAEAGWRL